METEGCFMESNRFFPEIRGNFGFGMMRLPMVGEEVDIPQTREMVDAFLAAGFNYFDTAHVYIGGRSETAIREVLSSRYPRERFVLANKLTGSCFESREEILPLFESQLEACGVDYFDFFLMHAQNAGLYEKYRRCGAYEIAFDLKRQGRVRHVGLSFHDKAAVLDRILTDYPELEFVQIQFNYADYDSPSVESGKVYEVCARHNKPVVVMEPVKGGNLVKLPPQAHRVLADLGGGSDASYALRYAAGFPQMCVVLSGMSDAAQMADNLSFMADFRPLDEREAAAVEQVREIFRGMNLIQCTACRYCTDGCPVQIPIPRLFSLYNSKKQFGSESAAEWYGRIAEKQATASACVQCGQCEDACPQHLPVRALLQDVAEMFGR